MRTCPRYVVLNEFTVFKNRDLIPVAVFGDHHRLAGRSFENRQGLDPAAARTAASGKTR
jgi:hypothetical protein